MSRTLSAQIAVALLFLIGALAATAQTFTNLASFTGTNGEDPYVGALAQGTDGNFYGTTINGGTNNVGTVFKVTPAGRITTIYSFCSQTSCTDGANPYAGVMLGTDGNFYGTTSSGGASNFGTVFKVTSAGKLTTLHSFTGPDGEYPQTPLIQATNGSFYGTTVAGGTGVYMNTGTIFQITSAGKFTSLYTFCPAGSNCSDGFAPNGLVQGSDGNFYGTTYGGGIDACNGGGAAWKITSAGTFTVLFDFCAPNGVDGYYPNSKLVQASNGKFYGTTIAGGSNGVSNSGTIFEISPTGAFASVYSFCVQSGCPDGSSPNSLIRANDGNLYGATVYGGSGGGQGTVFEITPTGQLTTLHSMGVNDGQNPFGTLLQGTNGIFYATTYKGGTIGHGTLYSVSTGLPAFVTTLTTSGKVGANVTILGIGLSGTTAVSFNGTAATFTASNGKVVATIPAGATTGLITVTTPTSTLSTNANFKVTPQLLSFSPPSGPVGTVVTITGVSLTQTSKVTFNGKSASFTVNSDTQVTATVPTGATTGKIVITTPGGSAASASGFTVN